MRLELIFTAILVARCINASDSEGEAGSGSCAPSGSNASTPVQVQNSMSELPISKDLDWQNILDHTQDLASQTAIEQSSGSNVTAVEQLLPMLVETVKLGLDSIADGLNDTIPMTTVTDTSELNERGEPNSQELTKKPEGANDQVDEMIDYRIHRLMSRMMYLSTDYFEPNSNHMNMQGPNGEEAGSVERAFSLMKELIKKQDEDMYDDIGVPEDSERFIDQSEHIVTDKLIELLDLALLKKREYFEQIFQQFLQDGPNGETAGSFQRCCSLARMILQQIDVNPNGQETTKPEALSTFVESTTDSLKQRITRKLKEFLYQTLRDLKHGVLPNMDALLKNEFFETPITAVHSFSIIGRLLTKYQDEQEDAKAKAELEESKDTPGA